ncbi:MAG: response regulator transcription factor [Ktedonobacterales bacterium]
MTHPVDNLDIHANGHLATSVMDLPSTAPTRRILTQRQLEILSLLYQGMRPLAIAEELTLSVATVRTALRDAYRRLGASGSYDALTRARLLGLFSDA